MEGVLLKVQEMQARRTDMTLSPQETTELLACLSQIALVHNNAVNIHQNGARALSVYMNNQLLVWSKTLEDELGYSFEEIRNHPNVMHLLYGYDPEELARVQDFLKRIESGEWYQEETFYPKAKDGTIKKISYTTLPFYKKDR